MTEDKRNIATQWYIDTFLNKENSWRDHLTVDYKIGRLEEYEVDWKKIRCFIRKMPRSDFFKTMYWKAVSAKSKQVYRVCCVCGIKNDLLTRESPPESHGEELQRRDELLVICRRCNQRYSQKDDEISRGKLELLRKMRAPLGK